MVTEYARAEVQGLVAQEGTVWETLEIARDVGRKRLKESGELVDKHLKSFDDPLIIEP